MSELFQRLKEERARLGMSQNDFATAGGVKRRAQQHYETGERCPDGRYLESIAKIGADVSYILTGKANAPGLISTTEVPIYDAFFENIVGQLELTQQWLDSKRLSKEHVESAVYQGDMMEPLLNSGETFIYDNSDKALDSGKTYVIRLLSEKQTLVGKVQRHLNGLSLRFENNQYPAINIGKEELSSISVMGKVVLSIREWN